jgi:hypothetical protein
MFGIEETGMTIQLANKEIICHVGIVRDVQVLVGEVKYPVDFVVIDCPQDSFCLIIFGRPFLQTVGAKINLPKEKVVVSCASETLKFNVSKFVDKPYAKEHTTNHEVVTLSYASIYSSDVVERYMLEQDEKNSREEIEALEQEFMQQPPILQLNIPPDDLGKPPPPKAEPGFEHKPLPEHLKYAYLDLKSILLLLVLSDEEDNKLLNILKALRIAIGYSLDDLKGISPA